MEVMTDAGFYGNFNTRIFHRPFCPQARRLAGRERLEGCRFATAKDAEAAGYRPCGNCQPSRALLLHKRTRIVHLEGSPCLRRTPNDKTQPIENFTTALDRGYEICSRCCRGRGRPISGIRQLEESRPNFDSIRPLCFGFVYLACIELTLNYAVRRALIAVYKGRWWKDGVPPQIRKDCVTRREDDPDDGGDNHLYMDFIHYKEIIDKRWEFFEKALPPAVTRAGKREFLKNLDRLNRARNFVMHPTKSCVPGRSPSLDSPHEPSRTELIGDMYHMLQLSNWRFAAFEKLYQNG